MTLCISNQYEFQCITNENLTSICQGVVFFLLIIPLILPILHLSSEMNDLCSLICSPKCNFLGGVVL